MLGIKKIIAVSAFALAIGVAFFASPIVTDGVSANCSPLLQTCRNVEPKASGDTLFPTSPFSTNFAPNAVIDSPYDGARLMVNPLLGNHSCSVHNDCSSDSVKVSLEGHATDREDGTLYGPNLRWIIDSPVGLCGGMPWPAGEGNQADVVLFDFGQYYFPTGGGVYLSCTDYEIKLIARDSNYNYDTDIINVSVCQPVDPSKGSPV